MISVELPAPVILVQLLPYMVSQLYRESHGFDPITCDGCAMKQLTIRSMAEALESCGWGVRGEAKKMVDAVLRGELLPDYSSPV